jgi:hypothetical protein
MQQYCIVKAINNSFYPILRSDLSAFVSFCRYSLGCSQMRPAAKRPRPAPSATLIDITSARSWPDSGHIFGLHAGATPAHLSTAKSLLKSGGFIHCYACSTRLAAHKTTWTTHFSTQKCVKKRADPRNRFNPVLLGAALAAAPRPKHDELRVRHLLCSSLAAAGMTPAQQAVVFKRGSPELAALVLFASTGLPASHSTTSQSVSGGAAIVRRERIGPALREAVAQKLPIAVLADESSTKRMVGKASVMQVWFHQPLLLEPLAAEVIIMDGGTAEAIRGAIEHALIREGWLSQAEFTSHVKTLSTDHAAAMLRAGRDMNMVTTGDPPHAVALGTAVEPR